MPALTVVVPCYNESRRLEPFFALLRDHRRLDWQWLFVDDGSSDDTAAKIQALAQDLPERVTLLRHQVNQGKGAAVRSGFLAADGDMVGYVDADLAASPLEFARFLAEPDLRAGAEILVGIRVKTEDGRVERRLHRHLMGRAFQTYTSVLTGLVVYDTQCGFKLLSQTRARQLAGHMQCDGFAFDVELLMLARRLGMTVREEMIHWQEKGDSRVRPKHILHMAWDIIRIRRRLRALPAPGRGNPAP